MKRTRPTASSRTLPNGRNRHERFVKLDHYLLNSPAYRSLGCHARALLVELEALYNGRNNGALHLSVRQAQKRLGVGRKAAEKARHELQDRGLIAVVQKGSFTCKVQLATTWRLTEHEHEGRPATKEFVRWTAPSARKNAVPLGDTDGAPGGHRAPAGSGRGPRHGAPEGHRERPNGRDGGAPGEHTVNLPSRSRSPSPGGTALPAQPTDPPSAASRHRADGVDRPDSVGQLAEPPTPVDVIPPAERERPGAVRGDRTPEAEPTSVPAGEGSAREADGERQDLDPGLLADGVAVSEVDAPHLAGCRTRREPLRRRRS